MQVVHRTENTLTLRERPIVIWFLGGLIAALGLFIYISSEWPVDGFGAFCIVLADLAVLFAPVETCAFDKTLDQVVLKRQGWLGTQVTERLLHKISDVRVEESIFLGTHLYQVRLVLTSGRHLPVNWFPSSDLKQQREIAGYIRRFLKLYHSK